MATAEEIEQALDAILSTESSRRYGIVGPTHPRYGRALGGFQVMESNLRPWLREAGMPDMTPDEFLANPEAQRNLFRHRFGQYANRYGLEGAARAWFAGEGGMYNDRNRDVFGTTPSEYARRFNARLGVGGVADENLIPTTTVSTPDVRNNPERPENWTQWLGNPVNRAFLMSAGAQMAQPTWGNFASQFASGLAAGQGAAADTGQRIEEAERHRLGVQTTEVQNELNRRSAERRTSTAAESRLDVAGLRANAMLERARIIGLRQPSQQNEFMRTVRALYSTLLQNNPSAMTNPALQEQLFNQAMEQAERTYRGQRDLAAGGGVTTPPPRTTPPPTTPPPASAPPPRPEGRMPPPAGPAPTANPPNLRDMTWEQFQAHPRFRDWMTNPTARTRIYMSRPDFRELGNRWLQENGGR